MSRHIKIIIILSLFLLAGINFHADANGFTWTGASDGDWTNPLNWTLTDLGDGSTYPGDGTVGIDTVDFSPGLNPATSPQAGCNIASLTVGAGGTVTPLGAFTVTGAVICDGVFTSNAAGTSIGGNLTGGGTFTASSGTTTFGAHLGVTNFIHNDGTVVFDGAVTPHLLGFAYDFYNLSIANLNELDTNNRDITVEFDLTGAGDLTAGTSQINIGRDMSLTGTFTADTSTVIFDTGSNGNVSSYTFNNVTVNKTGTGTVSFATGTSITILVITDSDGVTFSGTLNSTTVTLNGTTGDIAFQGNAVIQTLNTANAGYNVSFTGANNTITNDVNFLNTGTVTLGDTGDSCTFNGGLATSGNASNPGTTSIGGTVATSNDQIDLGSVTLTDDSTVNSGTAALNMAAAAGGGNNLLISSTGTVACGGAVTTGGGNYTVSAASSFDNTGGSVDASAGGDISITAGGAVNIESFLSTDGAGTISLSSTGGIIALDADLDLAAGALTCNANSGINQTAGTIIAGGTSSFTGGAGVITLTTAGNDFTGAVSLSNSGANAVQVTDTNAIILGTVNVGTGTLTVNTTGSISQSGVTTITQAAGAGAASFSAGANTITLTNANDFTGAVGLSSSGASVSVTDVNALTLSAPVLGANTGITAIAGTVLTLPAGAISTGTGNIDLRSNGGVLNIAGPLSTTSGTITLVSSAALSINDNITTTLAGGDLSLTGLGVTQTGGVISIAGTTTVTGGAGVITLTNANDFTGAVSLSNSGANAVQLTDTNAVLLGTVNTANNLTVNAVGISQDAGGITAGGSSAFNGGAGVITLTNANDFTGAVSLTNSGANAVQLTDTNAVLLGTVNTANNLTVNAVGISQDAGGITAGGSSAFNGGAGVITLTTAGNDFTGAVSLTNSGANAVQLTDTNAVLLGTVNTANNLTVNAVGISQDAGGITAGGSSAFNGGAGVITLTTAGNDFTGAVSLSNSGANAVQLTDTNAVLLGTVNTANNLTVNAVGISQDAGGITAGGSSAFNGGAGVITLTTAGNDFTGAVSLSNSGANAVQLTDTNAVLLGTVNTANNLTVNAVGISQNAGGITVGGSSAFNGGAGVITLTTAGNDFTGAVSLTNSGANAVQVTDTNAIILGTVNVGTGTLTVNTAGSISQSGVTTITQAAGAGAASFSAGANTITLTSANDFTGAVGLSSSGASVSVTDVNALTLSAPVLGANTGITAIAGTVLTLPAGAISTGTGNIDLRSNGGVLNIAGPLSTTSGTITLVSSAALSINDNITTTLAGGDLSLTGLGVTQTGGVISIAGTTTVTGGAGVITLTNANDFTGAVSLSNSGANAVQLTDTNAVLLGTVNTANNLTVNAVGISQNAGGITAGGSSAFNGGAGVITLTTAGNDFTGAVSLSNSGANAVQLTDTNAVLLGTVNTANNLTVNAAGISQNAGGITVGGSSAFNGGAGVITLTTAGNDFTGAVALSNSGANNVSVTDTNAIILGTVNVGTGTLTVNTTGSISQSGVTTITQAAGAGAASFTSGANAITLTTAGNDFTGAVSLSNSGANAVQVTDANAIILGTVNVGTGTLTVNTTGSISQSGVTTITQAAGAGAASFSAGANTITLTNANDFTGAVGLSSSGASVSVTDVNALTLSAPVLGANTGITAIAGTVLTLPAGAISTGTGNIDLRSNGGVLNIAGPLSTTSGTITLVSSAALSINDNITTTLAGGDLSLTGLGVTQTGGVISIAGTTTVTGGAGVITLTNANDFTGAVSLSNSGANAVQLTDTNAVLLGTVNTANNLTVNAVGISQDAGGITAGGSSAFNGGAGVITLTTAGNDFTGAVSLSNSGANAVQLTDSNAVLLGTVNTANNLTVNAAGISQNAGGITAGGSSAFNGGAGVITLTTAGNDFTGAVSLTNSGANAVQLTDTNAVLLGTVNTANNLTVNAVGISQNAGGITVGGSSAFNGGAGVITLTTAGNDFTGAVSLTNSGANAVQLTDTNAVLLGTVNTANNLTVNAVGISQNAGGITAGGSSAFNGGAGVITLTTAGNDFTGAVSLTNSGANAVQLTDTNAVLLGTVNTANNLTVNAVGISQDAGGITAGGSSAFNGGAGVITLTTAGNDFTGAVSLTNSGANAVQLTDTNAVLLGTVNTANNLTVNAVGISQDAGGITAGGSSAFNGGAGVITLTTAGNDFTGAVALSNSGANAVQVTDTNAIVLGTVNVGTGALTVNAAGAISQSGVTTITQAAGAGIASFAAGANTITLTNANDFTGAVALSNSGANAAQVIDINSIVLGPCTIGGNLIVSAGGTINNTGAILVTGSINFTAAGAVSDIVIDNTITAGNNPVLFTAERNIDINAVVTNTGTGTITFNSTTGGIIYSGANVSTAGGDIIFSDNTVIDTAALSISTGGAVAGNITFQGTVNGNNPYTEDITLNSGTGNISFGDALGDTVGAGNPLRDITITNTDDVRFYDAVTADSISQSAGTGTAQFDGALTLRSNGAVPGTGLDLTGNAYIFNSTVNTLAGGNGGTVTITNAGLLTIAAAGNMNLDGAFLQNGAGDVNTSADITTTTDNIQYDGVITIGDDIALDTGAGIGDITFSSTVDGGSILNLTAGTGNILIDDAAGGITRLLGLTVVSSTNIDINNLINADTQDITLTASGTVDIAGAVSTINGGTVTISNGGLLTLEDGCDMNLDGAFLQNGAGETVTGAGITTSNDNVTFNQTVYCADSTDSLTFSSGTGNLVFTDLHIYVPGRTVIFLNDFSCQNFIIYSGIINLSGNDLTLSQDFVAFGAAYDDDNTASPVGVAELFSYDNPARSDAAFPGTVLADPNASLVASIPLPVPINFTEADYAGSFSDLAGSTIDVSGNFYVNGCNMTGTGNWTLTIPDNASALAGFAEAYNMSVSYSQAGAGWVSACENVTEAVALSCANWDFTENTLQAGTGALAAPADWDKATGNNLGDVYPTESDNAGCLTVYDNVIRVEIGPSGTSKLFENSNDQISLAVAASAVETNNGAVSFTGSYIDRDCTTSTTGQGDLAVFYLKVADADSWNTDADGTTSGNGNSTDMGRPVALPVTLPANKVIIPDIVAPKGTGDHTAFDAATEIYISLIDNHKNRIVHYPAGTSFQGVEDHCRPVVAMIETGRDNNSATEYNWHNYFQIKYSEPVDTGTSAGFDRLGATAYNIRTLDVFAAAADYGGYIHETVADTTVTVEGYFSYPGTFKSGTKDPADLNPCVSSMFRAAPNAYGNHGMRIYAAGHSDGTTWTGFMYDVSEPNGQTATIEANDYIKDANGNSIDPKQFTIQSDGGTVCDWIQPSISPYSGDPSNVREVMTLDSDSDGLIDRLEIHILDNNDPTVDLLDNTPSGSPPVLWDSDNDHTEINDFNTNGYGIRESSIWDLDAFEINIAGLEPEVPAGGFSFTQDVDNTLFNSVDEPDDTYFALTFDDSALSLDYLSKDDFSYDSDIGRITDLAGNLLRTITLANCMERVPPTIFYTIGSAGSNIVYVRFSEYVFNEGTETLPIDQTDFTIAGGLYSISAIDPINTKDFGVNIGVLDAFFTLDNNITADDLLLLQIDPVNSAVSDNFDTPMEDNDFHRISDFAVGLVEPVWAADTINYDDSPYDSKSINNFTGNESLLASDITLQARLNTTDTTIPLTLFYDADVPSSSKVRNFWLPTLFSGYNTTANSSARGLNPFYTDAALRNFLIPGSDSEVTGGKDIEFIFNLGGMYLGYLKDPSDPRTISPWKIPIKGLKKQRGGVTILNNVINPIDGEKTILKYDLEKTGTVTINIFSLSGDVVKTLFKGKQAEGSYSFTWDGKNTGGRVVARGIYFIRLVGPDVDEYRKVMVVK